MPAAQDTVPVAARKALADMKDFLPYKGYRLLDTQWVLASNSGPAITRLRGVDDQEYELELRASPLYAGTAALEPDGHIGAVFAARVGDGRRRRRRAAARHCIRKNWKADPAVRAEISREIFQLERERDDLHLQVNKGRKQVEVGTADPDEVKRQARSSPPSPGASPS